MPEERETLTIDDLDRVYFRTQDDQGRWGNVNAKEATDTQFGIWAASRITIQGDLDAAWTPEERADFCNTLWQADALVILKKRFEDESESEVSHDHTHTP